MNIILTGMRGTGKTSIGKALAEKLDMEFVDTDEAIEKQENKSISELVSEYSWEYFRNLEKAMAKKVGESDNFVISTGGGIILDDENIKALKKNGIFVLLTGKIEVLVDRIQKSLNRPKLTKDTNPLNEMQNVWEDRKDLYMQNADITFDTSIESEDKDDDLGNKAEDIIKLLREANLLTT